MITLSKLGKWRIYWTGPLPDGAEALGTVTRDGYDTGALLRMQTGVYVQGNAGAIRSLPQREIISALARSDAARALGSVSTARKSEAVRESGKLGGRPGGMRDRAHYERMIEGNPSASFGTSLAAAAVYAARHGLCETTDRDTDEFRELYRELRKKYGEHMDADAVGREMKRKPR